MPAIQLHLTTPDHPGPVALIQASARFDELAAILERLTGVREWSPNVVRLVMFAGIDRGLGVILQTGPSSADHATNATLQLMPHGGVRVVRLILDKLIELGGAYDSAPDPRSIYPEAQDDLEAQMLACLAQAASPVAVDLLLAQPALWRARLDSKKVPDPFSLLDRLIVPPLIAVIGRPNVGKSTLANRVTGREGSIVADLPGTTRDWVAGLAELPPGVAVRWVDTPGIRTSEDVIEQQAIELAKEVILAADLRIAVRDPLIDWPEAQAMPRDPDLWVVNKIDAADPESYGATQGTGGRQDPIRISARTGAGMGRLAEAILDRLGLTEAIRNPGLWAFSPSLKREFLGGSSDQNPTRQL